MNKTIKIGLIIASLVLISPVLLIWAQKQFSQQAKADSSLISPLASKTSLQEIKPAEPIQSLSYYLSLATSFLEKATRLANDNPQQSEVDKLKIVNTLNEALKAANQAIANYPVQAEGYLVRAKVFKRAKLVWPDTAKLAQRDLNQAKILLNSPEADEQALLNNLPADEVNPINFIPAQQAKLASNLTIAGPDDNSQFTNHKSQTTNNTQEGEATIPVGETEITVQIPLKADDLVYTVLQENPNNQTLSVSAKTESWFRVKLDSPAAKNLKFDWWIISSEAADE